MSPSYLRIYFILVLSIMTQVKYGILQLDGTTEAFPSQKNETTTEAFHLQFNGTIETFPSRLNGTTEAPPLNGTIAETFHLQLNGKTEKYPSPLDATTEAFPSRHVSYIYLIYFLILKFKLISLLNLYLKAHKLN